MSASQRFVLIGTTSASIGGLMMPLAVCVAAYGSSGAVLNYITRKIHFENEWLGILSERLSEINLAGLCAFIYLPA